ncbi:hypothetical protein SSX86_025464 [Deinandra increscens subsp. villosa]|uniref:Uncharacterized protein n=1 Tax=Deinandra increscens subsp. villosa TaxID=3103831 RepID=A0AAP0CD32_9ASTR
MRKFSNVAPAAPISVVFTAEQYWDVYITNVSGDLYLIKGWKDIVRQIPIKPGYDIELAFEGNTMAFLDIYNQPIEAVPIAAHPPVTTAAPGPCFDKVVIVRDNFRLPTKLSKIGDFFDGMKINLVYENKRPKAYTLLRSPNIIPLPLRFCSPPLIFPFRPALSIFKHLPVHHLTLSLPPLPKKKPPSSSNLTITISIPPSPPSTKPPPTKTLHVAGTLIGLPTRIHLRSPRRRPYSLSRSRSASPLPGSPYNLRSRNTTGADKKPSSSRSTRCIRTFADLNLAGDESGSDSDEPQEYYTGGEKR